MATQEKEVLQFGAIAIKLGYTTLERVDECMRIQEKMRALGVEPKKVGEVMLSKGYLTEEQIAQIFRYQGLRGGHTQIIGYKILTKIGQGAMGSIYKAIQISMDRVVAIKVLSPRYAQNDAFRERFLKEARAVARLNHPNIIQGIDVGESNGIHYFAMEYIDGPNVHDLLKRGGALDEAQALSIVTQVAKALQHAFRNGFIHRDVKPDNIMLTRDGSAKLCDLGLAKKLNVNDNQPGMTKHGSSLGTPHYISPEQALGREDVDFRSDIYSLGASLYHMVVGDVAFPSDNAAYVISKHLTEMPPAPHQRNPNVTEEVEFILNRMLQKNRDDRHQTYEELIHDLEAVSSGGAPEGFKRPDTKLQSLSRRIRRRRISRRFR
ncbi:MAG: hypothetical protein A2Z34_00435 [Planctomycetes bacterium RBG_16_59_8]|nr:MAG: hypothetical protein A2Z34_00435 [Planctomycetes bacterium RBG_16_59_8]